MIRLWRRSGGRVLFLHCSAMHLHGRASGLKQREHTASRISQQLWSLMSIQGNVTQHNLT